MHGILGKVFGFRTITMQYDLFHNSQFGETKQ